MGRVMKTNDPRIFIHLEMHDFGQYTEVTPFLILRVMNEGFHLKMLHIHFHFFISLSHEKPFFERTNAAFAWIQADGRRQISF